VLFPSVMQMFFVLHISSKLCIEVMVSLPTTVLFITTILHVDLLK
jgi:hypothetical protein